MGEFCNAVVGNVACTSLVAARRSGPCPSSPFGPAGRAVITGDTLFNGGPGKTFAKGDLEVILASIDTKLLPLPDGTAVLPGHGGATTIFETRSGREEYRRHPKASGFHGDVEWRS